MMTATHCMMLITLIGNDFNSNNIHKNFFYLTLSKKGGRNTCSFRSPFDDSNTLHDGNYLMHRAKLCAYVNNNIDIKRILQDKQFHLQLKSERKEIIQNVLERKDSMAVLPTGFGKSFAYKQTNKYFYCQS
jgi:hypothetical protein